MGARASIPAVALSLVVGLAAGLGGYTFLYAKGLSYLRDDPAACANCHIMEEHLDGWLKSSHRAVATCNDCHTPPGGAVAKVATKAENGFRHSLAFTTGRFPDPLRITARNRAIAEAQCRRCHGPLVAAIELAGARGAEDDDRRSISCLGCHGSVGHMR